MSAPLVALFLVVAGLTVTYIAVGMARAHERRQNRLQCDRELQALRRQFVGKRS